VSLDFAAEELAELSRRGLRRALRTVRGPQAAVIELDGRRVVNVSANDYLGLAADPALASAAGAAAERLGTGAGASRLIAGNNEEHEALEAELAAFFGRERALLFNSGYHANLGVLQALAGPGDVVVSDALNHASIIDGCRLSRASVEVTPHRDVAAVERALAARRGRARRLFVVTDGLFSMDGDRARLAELAALVERWGAALVVDEAHAVGVLGDGRGVAAECGVRPDVIVGTLGKALGSFGAFAVGDRDTIELLVNRARSFVFTTALPATVVAASRTALALVAGPEGAQRRARLAARSAQLGAGLAAAELRENDEISHICPITVGDDAGAMRCAEALLERGYYAQGIRPPTVPAGTARLRIALSAAHSDAQVEGLVAALVGLRERGWLARRG
jgi:8-amino-7-oxononanoate synthase